MVGKRNLSYQSTSSRPKSSHSNNGPNEDEDIERGQSHVNGNGNSNTPHLLRFKDVANTALENQRREELKKQLVEGLNQVDLERFRKSKDDLKELKNKKVKAFYEDQNNRLDDWAEVDALVRHLADDVLDSFDPDHDNDGRREREDGILLQGGNIWEFLPDSVKEQRRSDEKKARYAINVNVIANIFLLIAKVVAVCFSSSLSLIASTVDSALDLLCTLIVWTTNRLVQWRLKYLNKRFPVGRRRLEPLGILVFSIIMVISFIQILQESVTKLLPDASHDVTDLPPLAISAMAATIGVKGIIGLGCWRIKTTQVQALVQDCKTDVIFNTISLLFPLIGVQTGTWWLDPVGAGLLALFIIYDWASTCFENITRLSGQAADEELLKKVMYLCYRFSPVVEGFKSVTAYHAGDGVWVEVDILLKDDTKLHKAHDISETLQYCLEGLNEVDRAFVSVDYTSQGPTGHAADAERT